MFHGFVQDHTGSHRHIQRFKIMLHLNGIQVLAAAMRSATQVASVDLTLPVAIVLGSEDKGIYPALQKQCDLAFSIP
ncbi:MAG: TrmH family RNA methyltransferase, partial [Sphingomonadales bacterium]